MSDLMSASAALRTKTSLLTPALSAAAAELWRPEALRPRYIDYLHTMHALIRASVPLMERAAERCARLAPHDLTAEPLGRYFTEHAEEERGHDDWLLEDLAAAGTDPAAVLDAPPDPVAAELAGVQYYRIEHQHPVVLLGYIAVLEGNAPAPWLADRLAAGTALPEAAFRTLRAHAALDTRHTAELDALLDMLPLTAAQQAAIGANAIRTADLLIRIFRRLSWTDPRQGAL
jgi:hypothetical protein